MRLHYKFGRTIHVDKVTQAAENILNVLNEHLEMHNWLATYKITIADIAMYPYVALANEVNVDLEKFIFFKHWLARIESLKGFVAMPGIILQ